MSGAASAVGHFLGFGGGPSPSAAPVAPTAANSQADLQKAGDQATQAKGQAADFYTSTTGAQIDQGSLSRQVLLGS